MTAIPAQRSRRAEPVTVTDEAMEIAHLRITHPETVAIARREMAEHGPAALAETVSGAVVVGMVATGLQRSTGAAYRRRAPARPAGPLRGRQQARVLRR
ncbi:hypothetical protein [Blastococcus sp. CCUG 61487]|uniref:hypothetical protein n=1 Tax=Blastococcus sp. CCUG 61487 TaxID=1840703 RepID=UPI0010C074DA|nr:hypothetical protein [Blastococcus sp. CCUG 61487]